MPFTIYWQLMNNQGSGTGSVNTATSEDQFSGSWAKVEGIPPDTPYRVSTVSSTGPWETRRTLPAEVIPDDRTPVQRRTFGNRPNVVPEGYHQGARAGMIDPDTHPHIMGVTHRTVRSGRFSESATWNTGTVPGAGSVWAVAAGHTLIGDNNSDVIFKDCLIEFGGTFRLATDTDTKWRFDTFMSMSNLILVDKGVSTTPGKTKHQFIFHASQAPGTTTRLGLMTMGPTRICGAKKLSRLRVGLSPEQISAGENTPAVRAGDTRVYLPGLSQSGWRIGQIMEFGGTRHLPLVRSDPQYTGPLRYYNPARDTTWTIVNGFNSAFQFGQEEERLITDIQGDWAYFAEPLNYDHIGLRRTLFQGQTKVISPVVGNPSQSIEFRTASAEEDGQLDGNADINDPQKRGHAMFMYDGDVDVRYCGFKNLGRTDTNCTLWVDGLPLSAIGNTGGAQALLTAAPNSAGVPIANPLNVRGRYAGPHFHWSGGPFMDSPLIPCVGVSVWAPLAAPPLPGWGFVAHASRVSMEECFAFNVRGAGFVSELGNEQGQWINCLAMFCRGDGERPDYSQRHETHPNHNDSSGVGFGNQSRAIMMEGNIAVSCHQAYLWHAQKSNYRERHLRGEDVQFKDGFYKRTNGSGQSGQDDYLGHMNVQIPPFTNNEAHACEIGFNVIHRLASIVNGHGGGSDKTPMLIENFHCLDVQVPWRVGQYSNWYLTKDCLWHRRTLGGSGATMGNVSWGWTFANIHLINFSTQFSDSGAGLNYDGFFIDITYEGGGSFGNSRKVTRTALASHPAWNVMGDAVMDAGSTTTGLMRTYRNLRASDLPQPYPTTALGGYGGTLPSGRSRVPVGGTPYFIPEASNTQTLIAGAGVKAGSFTGRIVDSVGVHKMGDYQSSESDFSNVSNKGPRDMSNLQPEQLVQWWGCWNEGTAQAPVWKTRAWFPIADRYTHVRSHYFIEVGLSGFDPDFLALHDIGGPSSPPGWPVLEATPANQPPLQPVLRSLQFVSVPRVEVPGGTPLAAKLVVTEPNVSFSIVGGADAAMFRISQRQLQWAGGGTQPYSGSGSNTRQVTVRARDGWGNSVDMAHTVVITPSARLVAEVTDNFNRSNQSLTSNSAYLLLSGAASSWQIESNRLSYIGGSGGIVSLANLGVSDQELDFTFYSNGAVDVLMRMVDANNYITATRRDAQDEMRLGMVVNGEFSTLAVYPNAARTPWRIQFRDRRVWVIHQGASGVEAVVRYPKANGMGLLEPLENSPRSSPGGLLLPSNAPMGTQVGVGSSSGSTVSAWLDDFSARRMPL